MKPATSAPETAPLLDLNGIRKSLGGRLVLDDVSLQVHPGETVVLLGPNGAGKTTLLGTACGRIAPDDGRASLAGGDPRRNVTVRQTLGFVPQQIALYPYLSVRENLEVFGRMMGVAKDVLDARIDEALTWSGLEDRVRDRVDVLSGGMQRRLNIVASVLHRPGLIMLDEPTVGVDVNARERIHELLRRLRADGLGILLTTHDLLQATTLADRVVFLLAGRVRLEGAPNALIRDVYGDNREITITLTRVPGREQHLHLTESGLAPVHDGRTWTGSIDRDFDGVAQWNHRLTDMALDAAEIRVREPSLEGVFLRLTGEVLNL